MTSVGVGLDVAYGNRFPIKAFVFLNTHAKF